MLIRSGVKFGSNLLQQVRTVPVGSSGSMCDDILTYEDTELNLTASRRTILSLEIQQIELTNLRRRTEESIQ